MERLGGGGDEGGGGGGGRHNTDTRVDGDDQNNSELLAYNIIIFPSVDNIILILSVKSGKLIIIHTPINII